MTGGEALQAVIKALGVTQSAFAADCGISAKHLNQLVKGHANFNAEMIATLADGVAVRLMTIDTRHRVARLRQMGGVG